MLKKKEIIFNHKENLKIIKKHNKNYYINDKPEITDAEYDQIKKEAIKLEKEHSFLNKYGSVSEIVGSKPLNKFRKIKHLSPMLSLANAFDIEDMNTFLKKNLKFY